jgi:hypothetical protein
MKSREKCAMGSFAIVHYTKYYWGDHIKEHVMCEPVA